jgi:MarR family transcriptional regulator for hemolysin
MSPDMQLIEQPLGRMLSILGKGYLNLLRLKLQHLDIDRNYYALVLIARHDGIITQQELALLLDSDKVSIVRIVDYLSENGYVQRRRKADDKRKHSLNLTEKGRMAIPGIEKSFTELNDIVLDGFEISQITELTQTINKLKHNINKNTESR